MTAPHAPSRRHLLALGGGALSLAAGLGPARAQADWPDKPVTFIVPFPAGGGTDAFARPLSAELTKQLGKTVIVDNRGGAGGTLGASIAARSPADTPSRRASTRNFPTILRRTWSPSRWCRWCRRWWSSIPRA